MYPDEIRRLKAWAVLIVSYLILSLLVGWGIYELLGWSPLLGFLVMGVVVAILYDVFIEDRR